MPRSPARAIQARQRSRSTSSPRHTAQIPSGAPLVTSTLSSRRSATIDRRRRSKSNGISSSLRHPPSSSSFVALRMAASSGLRMPVSKRLLRRARASGRGFGSPSTAYEPSTSISPTVSVPVLSLHRMSMLPRFWIAARCLTMTCCWAIREAPCASVTVVIIGKNSGVSPTARATANRSDSKAGRCMARLAARSTRTRTRTVRVMSRPKWRRPRSNSVSGARAARRATTSPNSVELPVAVTIAVAVPLTIDVPSQTVPALSPSGAPASFSTGSDSPVSAASWTWRSRASRRRASAGTMSPADRRTTSPGTSSRRGSSFHCPSRKTVAVGAMHSRSFSAAFCERHVWTTLMATLKATIPAMSAASTVSPSSAESPLATRRTSASGFPSSGRSCARGERRCVAGSL